MHIIRPDLPNLFGIHAGTNLEDHQLRPFRPYEKTSCMRAARLSAKAARMLWVAAVIACGLLLVGIFARQGIGETAANLLFFFGAMGVTLVTLVLHSVKTASAR